MVNTFVISSDFDECARYLDRKRLGKQRVEAYQVLRILLFLHRLGEHFKHPYPGGSTGRDIVKRSEWVKEIRTRYSNEEMGLTFDGELVPMARAFRLGFSSHPIVRMWVGYENALKLYINAMIKEWLNRGYKNTMATYDVPENSTKPWWVYTKALINSHKASLHRKLPTHYEPTHKKYLMRGYIWTSNISATDIVKMAKGCENIALLDRICAPIQAVKHS